jgi:nucleotide-binding universal stress UspA family protein
VEDGVTKTIVAGYDGSEQAERVLVRAAELAQPLEAQLVVVSVGRGPLVAETEPVLESADPALVPTPLGPMTGGPPVPPPVRVPEPREPAEEQLLLERARGILVPRRVEADYVAETGDPAERLLHVADQRQADLIVIGRGEHRFLERVLGRTVDEKLARHADRDLLLVV